ncbi:MAG: hypothetical protein KDI46_01995 [Alphaproteobacteria bacterium]|nr:hypothetical protein [Alphaproteobacteria bacterium]
MTRLQTFLCASAALISAQATASLDDAGYDVDVFEQHIKPQLVHTVDGIKTLEDLRALKEADRRRADKISSELGCHSIVSGEGRTWDKSLILKAFSRLDEYKTILRGTGYKGPLDLLARTAGSLEFSDIRQELPQTVCSQAYLSGPLARFREVSLAGVPDGPVRKQVEKLQRFIKGAEQDGTISIYEGFAALRDKTAIAGVFHTAYEIPEALSRKVLENLDLDTSSKSVAFMGYLLSKKLERQMGSNNAFERDRAQLPILGLVRE